MTEKLPYEEIVDLATRAARWDVKRQLLEMFVEASDAQRRVAQHEAAGTQEWLTAYYAMFSAIVALQHLGCTITEEARQDGDC